MAHPTLPPRRIRLALLISALCVLAWSAISPAGRFNWLMETLPAMTGIAVILATYRRFPLTTVTYVVIWILSVVLMIGGHYTYANVPIGNWARDTFHMPRNEFDRFGHFFQGVVPAMVMRELLLRRTPMRARKSIAFICICVALAISAGYELFEWQYAVHFGGKQADDFLGSQGDIWDAQKDMFMALCGATASMLTLARLQDRQLRSLVSGPNQQCQ